MDMHRRVKELVGQARVVGLLGWAGGQEGYVGEAPRLPVGSL